ncbi:MAG: GNAT family N-acetyltransferase [Pseudomonadota bacterium]
MKGKTMKPAEIETKSFTIIDYADNRLYREQQIRRIPGLHVHPEGLGHQYTFSVAIDPGFKGQGIGTSLFHGVKKEISGLGADRIMVLDL